MTNRVASSLDARKHELHETPVELTKAEVDQPRRRRPRRQKRPDAYPAPTGASRASGIGRIGDQPVGI
jgi:hypothetical protein